ncbi:MAG: catalase, partial [Eubacterium sp.]|nr:catalase [Eubacterium sp.]
MCSQSDLTKYIKNAKNHLVTINRHRHEVMKNCFRCGLYKQGLLHDLSKYSWTEFSVGIKYFQGDRSPNDAEREARGYTSAWLHHKGRNKHHLEYWIDYDVKQGKGGITGMKMPDNYIVEMFCDRVAASKIYKGENYNDSSALEYYNRGRGRYVLH